MRQERKKHWHHQEKFEDGVLRVDACFARHSIPHRYQYRTRREDLPASSFGSSAVREEERLLSDVYRLLAVGLTPQGHESLEEFVEKHRDTLEVI